MQYAERVINNLATAEGKKDTPSLIDMKGLGRPKEFSGKEGFFTSGRRRRRRCLRVFEWSSEQATEISAAAIDLEFLPLKLALQWLHRALMTLTSNVRQTTLSPTRGRTRWRHGGDCRNETIRRQLEGNETCREPSVSLGMCSLLEASSERRTLGMLCVALQEEVEGQVG